MENVAINTTKNGIVIKEGMIPNKEKLFEDVTNDFLLANEKIFTKIVKKKQNDFEDKYYPNVDNNKSILCVFCGGSYTKRSRSIHNKTNKHVNCIAPLRKKLLRNNNLTCY